MICWYVKHLLAINNSGEPHPNVTVFCGFFALQLTVAKFEMQWAGFSKQDQDSAIFIMAHVI